jgi:Phosphatidylserine/phosphatidylglycerophosphate/cardiolipin synthases and related enzymes
VSVETSALLLPFELPEPAAPGAEAVEWLIDNANAYRALIDAIRTARATIWITQLALDADCVAYDVPGAGAAGVRIVDELLDAARRGVEVRVLLNASLLLDTAATLRAYLTAGAGHPRLRVRGVSRFPQLLHAKMVIVDETAAFLVGSPFANGYWDDSRHGPRDARRPMRELGGRPVHDVSTRLVGDPVRSLATIFAELWNDADDVACDDVERLAPTVPDRPDASPPIAVVRTGPGDDGPMEILPALLDGIASARETIYIEHQYLSSRPVADALQRALSAHQALELVVVLNQNPDVTAYRGWQNDRLRATGLLDHPRVGLFALWTSASAARGAPRQVNQVFVHSKVVLVDDRWALVGSANLDGVSLHSYGDDFTGALGRRLFRRVRNFDVNLVVSTSDTDADGPVRSLRTGLWTEHLGSAFDAAADRPTEGWLPLWRRAAACNANALSRHDDAVCVDRSFVLPYSAHATPSAQLADIGVLLAPETIELCFNPSWLEVRFSPNWVRNMFA